MLDRHLFNQHTRLTPYSKNVWRMVEAQETAATLNIVDTMQEQARLEELLDEVKPPYRTGTQGMHYLLKTAFRYPPLKYGSRFGTRAMPSFYYASEKPITALAETAYYRFLFLDDMQTPYLQGIDSRHSLFSVRAKTKLCLDLLSVEFKPIAKQLTDATDYSTCQAIGDWATTKMSVEVIRFASARHTAEPNLAIAEPQAIQSKAPIATQSWLCRTQPDRISFSSRDAAFPHLFKRADFLSDGKFPRVD